MTSVCPLCGHPIYANEEHKVGGCFRWGAAVDLDDPSDDVLAAQERRDEELKREEPF